MSVLLIFVAFASAFVTGCLAIHALQNWSELVTAALCWIFVVVVILVTAEATAAHMLRTPVSAGIIETGRDPILLGL